MKSECESLIRAAYVPQKSDELAGVVFILDDRGRGYSYVKYEDKLITLLSKKMPYGVGAAHPAYLIVRKLPTSHRYIVECEYIDKSRRVRLWEQKTFPTWVKKIHRAVEEEKPKKKVTVKKHTHDGAMVYSEISNLVEAYALHPPTSPAG